MERRLSLHQRKFIYLKHRDYNGVYRRIKTAFEREYPDRRPPAQLTIRRIVRKFDDTCKLQDLPRSGRPRIPENNVRNIQEVFEIQPAASIRAVAARIPESRSSVHRILKQQGMRFYRPSVHQALRPGDKEKRLEFCRWFLDMSAENPSFADTIIWTDESIVRLHGRFNRQNYGYWFRENQHLLHEKPLNSPGVSVWAGFSTQGVLGPFFFDANVDGQSYIAMLEENVVPQLRTMRWGRDRDIWWQQDGAPPHFATEARRFVDDTFPARWIGRGGTIAWPPRSPDLTPLDFCVWDLAKSQVLEGKPQTLEDVKTLLASFFKTLDADKDMCARICRSLARRCQACIQQNGGHFEHIIRRHVRQEE